MLISYRIASAVEDACIVQLYYYIKASRKQEIECKTKLIQISAVCGTPRRINRIRH